MNLFIISVILFASVHWSISANLDSVKLLYYHGTTPDKFKVYNLTTGVDVSNHPKFNNSNPTVFYFHGYLGNLTGTKNVLIVNSYLTRQDSNFIFVDWIELSNTNYLLDIIPNVWKIANGLSDVIVNLLNNGLNIQNLHLVGFSVGSHIAGLIGRNVQEKSAKKFKIKRITALDPAFPLFYPEIFYKPISKDDADFVDVIHSDAWLYGTPVQTGTVDFWPNGGYFPQGGCPLRNFQLMSENDQCTHSRALYFWAESIANKNVTSFQSTSCSSWGYFKLGWCDSKMKVVSMGIDAPFNIMGNYFLETNTKSPFSKGVAGATYTPGQNFFYFKF